MNGWPRLNTSRGFLCALKAYLFFLTSTAFVHKCKIRHTSFEIYRISENCPLGYAPKASAFLLRTSGQGIRRYGPSIFEENMAPSSTENMTQTIRKSAKNFFQEVFEGVGNLFQKVSDKNRPNLYLLINRSCAADIFRSGIGADDVSVAEL